MRHLAPPVPTEQVPLKPISTSLKGIRGRGPRTFPFSTENGAGACQSFKNLIKFFAVAERLRLTPQDRKSRRGSGVEQRTRNAQVNSSNLFAGSRNGKGSGDFLPNPFSLLYSRESPSLTVEHFGGYFLPGFSSSRLSQGKRAEKAVLQRENRITSQKKRHGSLLGKIASSKNTIPWRSTPRKA